LHLSPQTLRSRRLRKSTFIFNLRMARPPCTPIEGTDGASRETGTLRGESGPSPVDCPFREAPRLPTKDEANLGGGGRRRVAQQWDVVVAVAAAVAAAATVVVVVGPATPPSPVVAVVAAMQPSSGTAAALRRQRRPRPGPLRPQPGGPPADAGSNRLSCSRAEGPAAAMKHAHHPRRMLARFRRRSGGNPRDSIRYAAAGKSQT
jgi:hypothetical protein